MRKLENTAHVFNPLFHEHAGIALEMFGVQSAPRNVRHVTLAPPNFKTI
jgi:hypothetical protein